MKETGGYFELEYSNIALGGMHPGALKLNSARNCLAYILQSKKYSRVYLPYYTCDAVLEPIHQSNTPYAFYHINEQLELAALPQLQEGEALLYVNYFGLKNSYVQQLAQAYPGLIVDNSQALFSSPVSGVDTFYSLRKFAGVPDGAFLYYNGHSSIELGYSATTAGAGHLYTRKNHGARAGYAAFQANEEAFTTLPMAKMPPATEAFVNTYDFEKNRLARERNFLYLHLHLGRYNQYTIPALDGLRGPLCYPFLIEHETLRQQLLEQSIFVPTYWPGLPLDNAPFEAALVKNLLPLPVDQRYGISDMQRIVNIINTVIQ